METILSLIALAALGFGLVFFGMTRRSRRGRTTLWNTAPSLSVTPYDPNADTHEDGRLGYLIADAAITVRWSLVTVGATPGKTIKANTAQTVPIGTVDDTTDTLTNDLSIPLAVVLFGAAKKTRKVATQSAVSVGDWLIVDTNNPIYGMTDPGTAAAYRFGRALTSSPSGGGVVEFDPCLPHSVPGFVVIAAGEGVVGSTSTTADNIPVAGLLTTDIALVQLNARGGSETIVSTATAAGQINITLSANATANTTKYNYVVYRVNG